MVYRTKGDVRDVLTRPPRRDGYQHFWSEARLEEEDRVPVGKRERSEERHGPDTPPSPEQTHEEAYRGEEKLSKPESSSTVLTAAVTAQPWEWGG